MKKILFLSLSGEGFYSHRLSYAKHLIKNGNEVVLISEIKKFKKKFKNVGIKTINLPIKKRYDFNPIRIIKLIFKLNKIIKNIKPDILNNIGILPVLIGSIASYGINLKILNSLTGLGSLIINKNIKYSFLKVILKISFFVFIRKTLIIVQNKFDKKFCQKIGIDENKIFLIPGYGIQLRNYKKSKQTNKIPRVILHSRMLKVKGILDYYYAAKYLKKKKAKVKLFLYGPLDHNNPNKLTFKDIYNLNIKGYLKYMGNSKSIRFSLNKFDIGCLPSYREGLPRSVLECMASKLPIITTKVPGNSETVINKYNGLIIKKNNPKELALAINKLASDKALRLRMGTNSLKYCNKKFSTKTIFNKLDKLFIL